MTRIVTTARIQRPIDDVFACNTGDWGRHRIWVVI